ncbi:hypothetical protein HDV05_006320 [Chytridiales sp. JEL 0842]|nr:hypothetical protein HDV05_006320 [Chytridiales sp. JEL 0842]
MDAERKERLAKLRQKKLEKELGKSTTGNEGTSEGSESAPKLSFRNYDPLTSHLQELKQDTSIDEDETLEKEAKRIAQEAKAQAKQTVVEVELNSLAPMKAGFDLARELERKSEKLERETAYCIAENIRKRLKGNADALKDIGSGMEIRMEDDDDD